MSTLKTTYIQHPDSENPQILLSASGMIFSASAFQAIGSTLDLPSITTIAGSEILTQSSASATYLTQAAASVTYLTQENVPPSQYKAFSLFLSGM